MDVNKPYISRIRGLMDATGMTYDQISADSGVGKSTLYQVLSGRYSPSLDIMWALADYFAVPMDYLIGRMDDRVLPPLHDYKMIFNQFRRNAYENSMSARKPAFLPSIPDGYEAPWPYNLLNDIFETEVTWVIEEDQEAGLNYAISHLSRRESDTIYALYREGKNLVDISKDYGLSKERIRQIYRKGLRKLRAPYYRYYIEDGLEGFKNINTEKNYISKRMKELKSLRELLEIEEQYVNVPLSPNDVLFDKPWIDVFSFDHELSVRSTNCLLRARLDTVNKILQAMNDETILTIRGLGRKSLLEIENWLTEIGCHYNSQTEQWEANT